MSDLLSTIGRSSVFLMAVSFVACALSVKPIYNEKEQAKAERAVAAFHELHNGQNYQGLYELLDDGARRNVGKEEFLAAARQAYEKWGKVRGANLSEAKVFPGPIVQVKMIYNVNFEKGDAQEWFIWNIHGDEARLLQYQNRPGFDTPDSQE
jgi:hypothetical protein